MKNILVFALILVLFSSCKKEKKETVINEAPISKESKILSMGDFIDNKAGHEISGKAFIVSDTSGKILLRLEDFSSTAGPDVNVYLSKTPGFVDVNDLGDLKATKGNMTYENVGTIDINEYKYVLIWCKEFSVLFGHAELKK
jgi:hypothetical protein